MQNKVPPVDLIERGFANASRQLPRSANSEAWRATWWEVDRAGALQGWAPHCFPLFK